MQFSFLTDGGSQFSFGTPSGATDENVKEKQKKTNQLIIASTILVAGIITILIVRKWK